MRISKVHQGYAFGKWLTDCNNIDFEVEINGFYFIPKSFTKEQLRMLFKLLDFKYPRYHKGSPKSYTELTDRELYNHMEFIDSEIYHSKNRHMSI